MATQKTIMTRAIRIATSAGMDAHRSPVIDNAFLAEDLFPMALRRAVADGAGIEAEKNSLKRTYALTLAAGEASLPATVIEERLIDSAVYSASNTNLLASYEPNYMSYLRSQYSYPQLAYYTNRGAQFCYRGPKQAAGAATGEVTLYAIGMPDIPALLTSSIDVTPEVEERTIAYLAEMIRGIQEK